MNHMKPKQSEIKRATGKSAMFISSLVRGKKFTTDRNVAIEVAKLTGKRPIEHISEKLREQYLEAWPELGKLPRKK